MIRNDAIPMEESVIREMVHACSEMSWSRTGALIVFERKENLSDIIRTGTVVNADVKDELIRNIFYEGAPLHDGAMIIRDGRIHAAGCVLPLSPNMNLSKELGTRHRAAVGMSENLIRSVWLYRRRPALSLLRLTESCSVIWCRSNWKKFCAQNFSCMIWTKKDPIWIPRRAFLKICRTSFLVSGGRKNEKMDYTA